MLGIDTFVLRGTFREFLVRIERSPAALNEEQRALARVFFLELRFDIEAGEPRAIESAQLLLAALSGDSGFRPRVLGFSLTDESAARDLLRQLENELSSGRLVIEERNVTSLTDRRSFDIPKLPPLPPPRRASTTFSFEVRLIDEVGKPIAGIDAEFTADGAQSRPTNAAGIALLDGVQTGTATVSILDPEALSRILDPRWEKFRPGKPPKESNTQEAVFRGSELGPFSLKAEIPNTVVIKPPLGTLFAELWDKTGRVRHANRIFQITGPQSFEGTTDDLGQLRQERVFPGDYSLSLALDFSEPSDPDRVVDVVDSALVVLDEDATAPEVRMLGAVPRSVLARLRMFFDSNKAFLLPTALRSVSELRELYAANAPCELLVVGHADTKGSRAYNDQLSLERAQATIAYLKDDVDAWLAFYDPSVAQRKRWGKGEDHLMITAMPDFGTKQAGDKPVEWFQRTRQLQGDGVAGPKTRRALIAEYMSLDGVSLRDSVGKIDATAHGCGEIFPLDERGADLGAAPVDEKRDRLDRRVELFFFDPEFGITPPPPGPNSKPASTEYPLWRERVAETIELSADDSDGPRVTFVELADAHFRTNSAVVLPEGEAPDREGNHRALTSVGLIATVLRFNEEHPGRTLLVAGHTDTTADTQFNQKLSEERAMVALALLEGGDTSRETFKTVSAGRHTVGDTKQILSWVSRAIPGFTCDPGPIDDNGATAAGPVTTFQTEFNAVRSAIAPSTAALDPDGVVGLLTWGAFFDCYEFALQQELGEDATGVQALRDRLAFADPAHRALGFSEHFPIEELGLDNFRSQTNRRVELIFFEAGEEPDIQHSVDDPETSDLYLPGRYQRDPIPPRANGLFGPLLEISVFVGVGNESAPDGALSVLDQTGTPVQTIQGTDADDKSNGYCVFRLATGTLPDPCELRWETSFGSFVLAGPCAPVELRDAIDGDQPQTAGELALAGATEAPANDAEPILVAESGPGDPTSVVV